MLSVDFRPRENFGLTFGNLRPGDHVLLPALYDQTLIYERPTEHGLESYGGSRRRADGSRLFDGRIWINWQKLNTAEHREKFNVGSMATLHFGALELEGQLHFVHRGGQLYNAGPVTDNPAFILGGIWEIPLPVGRLPRAGLAARRYWSKNVADRETPGTTETGSGSELLAFIDLWGWRIQVAGWFGSDFFAEDGQPFYRADRLTRLSVRKDWRPLDRLIIRAGLDVYDLHGSHPYDLFLTVDFGALFPLFTGDGGAGSP